MDAHRVDERPPSARQQALLCRPAGGALPAGAEEGPCLRRQRRAGGGPGSVTREQGPGSPFLRSEVKTRPAGAPPPSGGRGGGRPSSRGAHPPPQHVHLPPERGGGGGQRGPGARPAGVWTGRGQRRGGGTTRPRGADYTSQHAARQRLAGGTPFPCAPCAPPPPRLTRHYTSQRAARPRCGLSLPGLHFPASPARRRPRCPAEGGRAACRER